MTLKEKLFESEYIKVKDCKPKTTYFLTGEFHGDFQKPVKLKTYDKENKVYIFVDEKGNEYEIMKNGVVFNSI